MHKNTPQSQHSNQSHNNKNSKKQQKTPHRSRINVKSRKQRNIPQIKIQLDQMLSQAFYQIQMQPKKNARIGPDQLYILDNQLLRDYVQAIYSQYGIEDPLAKTEPYNYHFQKNRSKSNFGSRPTTYQTPQKFTHQKQQSTFKTKEQKRQNKTAERLSKLKKNFQQQLNSPPKILGQNDPRTHKKIKFSPTNSVSSNSKPGSTSKKQSRRKQSEDTKNNLLKGTSHLLTKTKYKYCLMCQQPLEADLINSHQRECEHLQRLLNTPNLKIQQILSILDSKINQLQNQISYSQQFIYQDVNKFNSIATQILSGKNQNSLRQQDDEQESTLLKAFSMLNIIKCAELLDKLQWFRKMRGKAEAKRTIVIHEH